jgi:hypothetical protein
MNQPMERVLAVLSPSEFHFSIITTLAKDKPDVNPASAATASSTAASSWKDFSQLEEKGA